MPLSSCEVTCLAVPAIGLGSAGSGLRVPRGSQDGHQGHRSLCDPQLGTGGV